MNQKYADVISLTEAIEYLESVSRDVPALASL
jgi:hypothetical protein